jgi:hypothetical protein
MCACVCVDRKKANRYTLLKENVYLHSDNFLCPSLIDTTVTIAHSRRAMVTHMPCWFSISFRSYSGLSKFALIAFTKCRKAMEPFHTYGSELTCPIRFQLTLWTFPKGSRLLGPSLTFLGPTQYMGVTHGPWSLTVPWLSALCMILAMQSLGWVED